MSHSERNPLSANHTVPCDCAMSSANRRLGAVAAHMAPVGVACMARPCAATSGNLMQGQVAIVTGSGQGIGAEVARLFARHGAAVVVSDLDEERSNAVAGEIRSAGGRAISVPGNVNDQAWIDAVVKAAVDSFGSLTCIVANAGYTRDAIAHRTTDKAFDAMYEVHVKAPFRLLRAAAPHMRGAAKAETEGGNTPTPRSIVFISSTSGLHGNVGQANYAAAKAGVVGLCKTIAKEWGGFNIRANTVAFGHIDTRLTREFGAEMKVDGETVKLGIPNSSARRDASRDMIPLKRVGSVADAAGGVLMMAAPALGSYVTGHTLEVTGGVGI